MNKDFHYYATYCAAILAGYSHEESLDICYSAQFVDWCTVTFLTSVKAPRHAATTQLQMEMMDVKIAKQDIDRFLKIEEEQHEIDKSKAKEQTR